MIFNLPLEYRIFQEPMGSFELCGVTGFWAVDYLVWRLPRDHHTSPWGFLLKFDLTRFLDEVANVATAGSEEVGTNVTGDVVAATSMFSVQHLWGG